MIWLYLSAFAMIVTAVIHSVAGEKMILAPLLSGSDPTVRHPRKSKVIRSAWHLTSLFMLMTAAVVAWNGTPAGLVLLIGGSWLLVGVFSLVTSRGKHVGWPTLSASGIFAIIGAMA